MPRARKSNGPSRASFLRMGCCSSSPSQEQARVDEHTQVTALPAAEALPPVSADIIATQESSNNGATGALRPVQSALAAQRPAAANERFDKSELEAALGTVHGDVLSRAGVLSRKAAL